MKGHIVFLIFFLGVFWGAVGSEFVDWKTARAKYSRLGSQKLSASYIEERFNEISEYKPVNLTGEQIVKVADAFLQNKDPHSDIGKQWIAIETELNKVTVFEDEDTPHPAVFLDALRSEQKKQKTRHKSNA